MARRIPEERHDAHGPIRLMAQADGYRMVRRPGAMPFVLTDREWAALDIDPVRTTPCGSPDCREVCHYLAAHGMPCKPAQAAARPADLRRWADEREGGNDR